MSPWENCILIVFLAIFYLAAKGIDYGDPQGKDGEVSPMPLDRAFVGRRYPPTEPYEVGREKVREFARAIGDDHRAYFDVAAAKALGHPDIIAPPTFLIALTMPAEGQVIFDTALGFDFSRVLHRSQEFQHRRPVHAGDVLTVAVEVTEIDLLDGNDLLTLSSEARTTEGELVCRTVSTLLSRGHDGAVR